MSDIIATAIGFTVAILVSIGAWVAFAWIVVQLWEAIGG